MAQGKTPVSLLYEIGVRKSFQVFFYYAGTHHVQGVAKSVYKVRAGNLTAFGQGTSKKIAKQKAAEKVIYRMQKDGLRRVVDVDEYAVDSCYHQLSDEAFHHHRLFKKKLKESFTLARYLWSIRNPQFVKRNSMETLSEIAKEVGAEMDVIRKNCKCSVKVVLVEVDFGITHDGIILPVISRVGNTDELAARACLDTLEAIYRGNKYMF